MASKKTPTLSVAIAVFNEEKNIEACLSAVDDWADEIVVVDGGSSDKTRTIARQFTKNVITTDNPSIFHINKQKALQACTSDWILQLDADEIVTAQLKEEIRDTIAALPKENGFFIPRKNYFWGHFMRKGGQYPDYVIRLIRRGKGRFPSKSVHEQIEVEGTVGYLTQPLLHYSYRTRQDYWRKADSYTTLTAGEFLRKKTPKTPFFYLYYNYCKPMMTFLTLYVRHKGFVDGLAGLEFAVYSALHWAIAYRKYLKLR